jgi:hypothetical protein
VISLFTEARFDGSIKELLYKLDHGREASKVLDSEKEASEILDSEKEASEVSDSEISRSYRFYDGF